jgi:hypothetical protein
MEGINPSRMSRPMEVLMPEQKTLGRREFTVASAMAVLSGVAITLTACGGDSSSPSAPSPAPTPPPADGGGSSDVAGAVSSNHGHTAVITSAQITAGDELSLDITGSSNHPHTVVLSAAELQQIGAGERVSKESSVDAAHSHTVTFN